MEIYNVSDYLVNLRDYETEYINDLFGIENKLEIVLIIS